MFENLKNHIKSTELGGLYVNLSTGEWVGGPFEGYEYKSKAEILALEDGPDDTSEGGEGPKRGRKNK